MSSTNSNPASFPTSEDDRRRSEKKSGVFPSLLTGSSAVRGQPGDPSGVSGLLPARTQEPTKTANFKNWFGDFENPDNRPSALRSLYSAVASNLTGHKDPNPVSQVVDQSGSPRKVYHGTNAEFEAFDNQKTNADAIYGPGHYFTEDPDVAAGYSGGNVLRQERNSRFRKPRVVEAYLNIRNPFDADKWLSRIATEPGLGKLSYELIADALGGNQQATDKLKEMGYDGITHTGHSAITGKPHKVWVAFEPTQVKSTANEGTFDPNDPRMHKASGGQVPQVPGIPRESDEVPIKAQAGEFVVKNGPAQTYASQLEAMNRDQTPHFDKGGPVKPPSTPKTSADTYDLAPQNDQPSTVKPRKNKGDVYDTSPMTERKTYEEPYPHNLPTATKVEDTYSVIPNDLPTATHAPPLGHGQPSAFDFLKKGLEEATGGIKNAASGILKFNSWENNKELHRAVYGRSPDSFEGGSDSGSKEKDEDDDQAVKELTKAIHELIATLKAGKVAESAGSEWKPTFGASALPGVAGRAAAAAAGGGGGGRDRGIDWGAVVRMAEVIATAAA